MTTSTNVQENQPHLDHHLAFTACPLCQATESEDPITLQDWGYNTPGVFSLVRCCRCSLRYLNPRPTLESISIHYPSHYLPYRTAIEDEKWALMRYMRRRKLVRKRKLVQKFTGLNSGTILDVGCSTGLFLAEMKNSGWQTHGVEINAEAAQYARRRFGLNVSEGRLSDVRLSSATFDAVTMWDVLEHTFEPSTVLKQIYHLLKPNGIVVCIVPNERSLDRLLFRETWVGYDTPRHLTVFSPDTLRAIVQKSGFQIAVLRCDYGGYFSFITSLNIWLNRFVVSRRMREAILRFVNFPGMRLPFEPYFKGLDYLGYGNELLVVGRKAGV